MPLRLCALPALFLLLGPELEGLLPTELQPAFQERNGLIRQQLPNRHLQLLTPAVPAAGPEVEQLAAIAEPGLLGR